MPLPAEVKKRKTVAKDGTKRGVGNLGKKYKNRQDVRDKINAAVRKYVPEFEGDFDAVEMAAAIAVMAMTERPAKDAEGRPIIDERGNPLTVPPDYDQALRALNLVSRFTHAPVAPRALEPDDDGEDDEVTTERRALFREVGERLGFRVAEKDDEDDG